MMRDRDLLITAEKLVNHGLKQGADEVEISVSENTDFSVEVRQNRIEKLEEAGSRFLTVRTFKDQRSATATSSKFDMDTLKKLIAGTVRRTLLGARDKFLGLPEPSRITVDPQTLQLLDPRILTMAPVEKISIARELEKKALAMDKRISNSYGAWFTSRYETFYLVNSKGFSGSYRNSSWSTGVYLQAGPTDDSVQGGWQSSERFFDQLEPLEKIAGKAVQRTVRQLNPRRVPTQEVPVVLEPAQGNGLLRFLYQCVNGRNVYQERSFLTNSISREVAAAGVTVVDDGLLPGKTGTRPFDREGVPTRRTPVIEKGILTSFLTDTYGARKLGTTSTGNASGYNNFFLQAGTHTPEDIIRSVDRGLLLTMTMGQGTNPVTGDFSKGAGGLWIEKGEIVYPVAEITLSGNLGSMLKNIELIGSDLVFRGKVACPTLKITGLTLGGS
jgi:PmbA protein